jgi:hypothetical protein
MLSVNEVCNQLKTVYSVDTCYKSDVKKWTKDNPSIGHCAISALIIYDLFGGEIYKTKVGRSTHYFNILNNGEIVDVTAEQFSNPISYDNTIKVNETTLKKNVSERYNLLFTRFMEVKNDKYRNTCVRINQEM